jgi:hypothetical protein
MNFLNLKNYAGAIRMAAQAGSDGVTRVYEQARGRRHKHFYYYYYNNLCNITNCAGAGAILMI